MDGCERSSGQDGTAREPSLPGDFSPDEVELARALCALFPLADETLPPLYISMLWMGARGRGAGLRRWRRIADG